eukprot:2572689-Pyramimonas_sp.AAC.1
MNTDCPVDPDRLADQRRTYAINVRHGFTIDRADNWRAEDVKYHRPFEQNSNADSSDGDYHPSRWTDWAEFWIRDDCAPAT